MKTNIPPVIPPSILHIRDLPPIKEKPEAERLEELREHVREKAAERVKAKGMTRPTPYGTLTHAISGEAIRPATAREMGDFAVAQRHGRPCLHIAHVEAGQWWEEPYVVTPTKEMFFPEDK